jgi:hypothetical protein
VVERVKSLMASSGAGAAASAKVEA